MWWEIVKAILFLVVIWYGFLLLMIGLSLAWDWIKENIIN